MSEARKPTGVLLVELEPEERIVVTVPSDSSDGEPRRFRVKLIHKSGRRAKLLITADQDIDLGRGDGIAPAN